jgi:RNA polymerase sigma-70 factor, ECF subfamily
MSRVFELDTPMKRAPMSPASDDRPKQRRTISGEVRRVVPLCRAELAESELVAGVIGREPVAIAELYDRYAALVRRVLIRALGTDLDIDDVVQETFLTVVRRIVGLRDPAALRSFVVSVTLRLAKNELRKRALRRWVGLDQLDPPVAEPADDAARESVRHVYAALSKMGADLRLIFVLRHVEGLELTELAAAAGCSLATIKRRLARAESRFEALAAGDPVLRDRLRRDEP